MVNAFIFKRTTGLYPDLLFFGRVDYILLPAVQRFYPSGNAVPLFIQFLYSSRLFDLEICEGQRGIYLDQQRDPYVGVFCCGAGELLLGPAYFTAAETAAPPV
ncbi:hypothetical protein D3C75_754290 [compost metagenome]